MILMCMTLTQMLQQNYFQFDQSIVTEVISS